MLALSNSLHFPSLKYEGDTTFKSWGSGGRTILFSIDWEKFDGKLMTDYHSFVSALPDKWDTWLKNFQFAIPDSYLNEIHRCSRLGLFEWSRQLSFDTSIREMCMKTGDAFIKVAFNLIADCAYDPDTNYFYRGNDKYLLPNVMLYKFWGHQTGRGLLWDKAELDKLEKRIEIFEQKGSFFYRDEINRDCIPLYKGLLENVKEHYKKIDTFYQDIVQENVSVEDRE